jgi:hypothetical protein
MRRLVWCAVLLVGVVAMGWGQGAGDGSDAAARREAAQIRAAGEKLIASGAPDDVAKGAALLEKAAELEEQGANAEKLSMERQKLRLDLKAADQSHWFAALVSFIPLATTVILAGTLIFQIWQARVERIAKQRDAEEDRFMDALKSIQTSEQISIAAILISTFQDDPYKTRILDMSVGLLLSRKTMDDFQTLYMDVLNPLTYDKMPQMRRLCKSVDATYFAIGTPIWDKNTGLNDESKLSDQDRKLFRLCNDEQLFLSSKLGELLRTPAPEGVKVDLSQLVLREIDLSGVDLGSPNVTATNWTYVNLDGCDMSGVTVFDNCHMSGTAWWHAGRMSKPLVDFLEKTVPFPTGEFNPADYNTKLPVGTEEYAACVSKLRAGGSEVGGSRAWGSGVGAG